MFLRLPELHILKCRISNLFYPLCSTFRSDGKIPSSLFFSIDEVVEGAEDRISEMEEKRLIRSHSSARFCFELSGNLN